jgi:small subunit ribosomal protein S1
MAKKSRDFKKDPGDQFGDMYMSDAELEALMESAGMPSPRSPERRPETELGSLEPGARVRGTVIETRGGEVLVELDSKTHGVIPGDEFGDEPFPELGTVVDATFVRLDPAQGLALLSVQDVRLEIMWEELRVGMLLEGTVTGTNKGGLTLDIKKVRAFMPISQIERERVEDPASYVGRKLRCEVTSFDRATENLVVSRRAILDREAEAARAKALAQLTEGDVVMGTVVRLTDFGAFVDVGGFEGLLHKSKITEHHKEIGQEDPLHAGQRLEVEILRVDVSRGRVALGFVRRAVSSGASLEGFSPGDTLTGWVRNVTQAGATLSFEDGVEGMIPRRSMTDKVQEGAVLKVVITSIDAPARRIELRPAE